MASIVAWLIGLLFLGLGCWILLLRFEGLVDRVRPHNMSIGQMTVDGKESKGHAELLRARFDHHFRRPVALPKETGFLEVVSLDAPELFQPKGLDGALEKMTVEVSGVDVARILHLVNQLAKPDQWVVEGDFQTQSDRALLALRLSRGQRLIRTWYLERLGNASDDKSILLEQLVDDAIFQLVYDFGNEAEQDSDLRKWRRVVPAPTSFPSRAAVAAYYEARGALGRYYAYGAWKDLDLALDRLRSLRSQMPEYEDGLQLLGMVLAEKRNDTEAIHVYEQLRLLLLPREEDWKKLPSQEKRRLLSVDLLKATATAKLYTWQSAHEAVRELSALAEKLRAESASAPPGKERAAYGELLAQTAVQLAYTYALYLSYMHHHTVAEIFGSADAPEPLRVADPEKIRLLREGRPDQAKPIVRQVAGEVAKQHKHWIGIAREEQALLAPQWRELAEGERRKAELLSRLHLASGLAHYRMAEWERRGAGKDETVFGETFGARLEEARKELARADAAHPNHYLVLEFLGLVYSEPRREDKDVSIAEQYFERAILANPSDYYGHELLADILLRRVANRGVDLVSRGTIEKGLAAAEEAIVQRETSGTAHLLRAELLTMLLEIERDATRRRELRAGLEQHIEQADRYLPQAFRRPDPDLTWVRVVAATRRLGEDAEEGKSSQAAPEVLDQKRERFRKSKQELEKTVAALIEDCDRIEQRWVAHQRVFHIESLGHRARRLRDEIGKATLENWREIRIAFR